MTTTFTTVTLQNSQSVSIAYADEDGYGISLDAGGVVLTAEEAAWIASLLRHYAGYGCGCVDDD